jgi:hypothetical protein
MPDAFDRPEAGSFDLDALPLDRPVEGREGLDANHASRMRMQFLVGQHASLVSQTQFADAKAAALMTLMGLVALNGPVQVGEAGRPGLDALFIFVLMMVAIAFAIFSIVPRFPDAGICRLINRRDRFSWPALVSRDYEPLAHAEFMRTAEASQLIMSVAQSNGAMARVLHRKFRYLRIAFILGAIDLALIVLYVVGIRLG